ncbi:hypothetical protein NL676_013487 [Syzygium grande]|nr:hypothetical protein NL676_013487 [Syzygium grande]
MAKRSEVEELSLRSKEALLSKPLQHNCTLFRNVHRQPTDVAPFPAPSSGMIAAISWVPRGVSKAVPDVAQPPSKEEIEEILKSGVVEIRSIMSFKVDRFLVDCGEMKLNQ